MSVTYDLVIPLGYACSCSQTLRRAGLQLLSFPWDWVGVPPPSEKCRAICEGFKDWMNLEDLKWVGANDTYGHEEVLNTRNDLIILHDFAAGVPIEDQYPAVAGKYARRIERLDRCLRAARKVLLVCIDAPVTPEPTTPDDCRKAIEIMSATYTGAKFDFLLMNLEPGRPKEEMADETPLPGVRRIAFDYAHHAPDAPAYAVEIDMLADFLRREYAVREYRTRAEIRAHEDKKRAKRRLKLKKKWASVGAETMTQYLLIRTRSALAAILRRCGWR